MKIVMSFTVGLVILAPVAFADEALLDRIREEAVPVWKKLAEYPLQIEGTLKTSEVWYSEVYYPDPPPDGVQPGDQALSHTDFLINGSWVKIHERADPENPEKRESVKLVNSKYSNRLQRKSGDQSFNVFNFRDPPRRGAKGRVDRDFLYQPLGYYINAAFTWDGLFMHDLIDMPNKFKIKKIERIEHDGKSLVQIVADYMLDVPAAGGVKEEVADLTLRFDPERSWSIIGYDYRRHGVFQSHISIEYDENFADFPLPRKYVSIQTSDPPGQGEYGDDRDTTELINLVQRAAPESEFGVSAFGLREPGGLGVPERNNSWMWYIAIGSVIVVLSIGIGLFGWRKKQNAENS